MRLFALPAIAVFCLVLALNAVADSDPRKARDAVKLGKAAPMEVLLDRVGKEFPGQVLKLELEEEDGTGWVYEVKVLGEDGVVVEVEYDAGSLKVLEVERGR